MEWNGPCENNEKSHARHQHPQEASRFFPSAWKRLGQASILSKNAYAHSLIHFFEMKNFFEYKEALHFHPLKLRKKKKLIYLHAIFYVVARLPPNGISNTKTFSVHRQLGLKLRKECEA